MAQTKYLDLQGLQYLIEKLVAGQVQGKGLVDPSVITEIQEKLKSVATTAGLTELTNKVNELNALVAADSDGVINKFNEIVAFLDGIADSKTLEGLLGDIATQIGAVKTTAEGKQSPATTLAGYGITDAKIAGGVITLGGSTITPLTAHQDISGKVDKVEGKGLSTNDYTAADKAEVAKVKDKLNAVDVVAISETEIDALVKTA